MKKLYVGNLSFRTTEDELRDLFSDHGEVTNVNIITDRESGRSRGFGFVEMEDGADAAIEALDGNEFQERSLKVNVAKDKESGGSRGGFNNRRGGGNNRGGGGFNRREGGGNNRGGGGNNRGGGGFRSGNR